MCRPAFVFALAIALGAAVLPGAASHPSLSQRRAGPATGAAPAPLVSIKELMDGIVDPAADVVFDAVSYNITAAGVEEVAPKTRDDWAEVRRHAALLVEAANLLRMPGRRVAPDGPFVEFEQDDVLPEDLTPEQIQRLVDADPAQFARLAQGLADAAMLALRAADAMDAEQLFASGDALDQACERCHLQYWYPKQKPAAESVSPRPK